MEVQIQVLDTIDLVVCMYTLDNLAVISRVPKIYRPTSALHAAKKVKPSKKKTPMILCSRLPFLPLFCNHNIGICDHLLDQLLQVCRHGTDNTQHSINFKLLVEYTASFCYLYISRLVRYVTISQIMTFHGIQFLSSSPCSRFRIQSFHYLVLITLVLFQKWKKFHS